MSRRSRILSPDIRGHERTRAYFFMALLATINWAQTLGLVGTETLFLVDLGVGWLPAAFILASVTTVLGSIPYAIGVGRTRNDIYFVRILLLSTVLLIAAGWVGRFSHHASLISYFCIYYLTSSVLVNHFWTFAGDYFDSQSSKRLFPLFTVGNSIGGAIGAASAVLLVSQNQTADLLLVWSGGLVLAALLVRIGKRRLRRWGPLELEEADETSMEGIRGARRYIGHSPLGRWMVLSAIGMVLSLFVAQYMYSDIFVQRFINTRDLALFLSFYLLVTNGLEVVLELLVTPRLIQRFGVARANWFHPVLTIFSFVGLIFGQGVTPAAFARANRELAENAVAAPIRTLIYNAVPFRLRGQARAFVEGIVVYGGMAAAGLLLMVLGGQIDPRLLAITGLVLALLYLGANLRVSSAYAAGLEDELRSGRIDLSAISSTLGQLEAGRLSALWSGLLELPRALSPSELKLPRLLIERGIVEPVERGLIHSNPRIRRACLDAFGEHPGDLMDHRLDVALEDSDATVRLTALQQQGSSLALERLRVLLNDEDFSVRASAAALMGDEGTSVLHEMALSADRAAARAALPKLGPASIGALETLAGVDDPELRALALRQLAELPAEMSLSVERVAEDLGHADSRVRLAALRVIARSNDPQDLPRIAQCLEDRSAEVRDFASLFIAGFGVSGTQVVLPQLSSPYMVAVESALKTLARIDESSARELIADFARELVGQAWSSLWALRILSSNEPARTRYLRAAHENSIRRSLRLVFSALSELEDARLMQTVEKVLRFSAARARGDALEVLSNLGDRETARLLVLLLEPGAIDEKRPYVEDAIEIPMSHDAVVKQAAVSKDPWIRKASLATTDNDQRNSEMERLLYLRQVPLFGQLTLDQLATIDEVLVEETYIADEVICREGELGSDLYILFEGEVEIVKNFGSPRPVRLHRQVAVTCFGEMAILADEPRSATVVATSDCRLLSLSGARLKELIMQTPEISFDFFRVLTDRLRLADTRMERMVANSS